MNTASKGARIRVRVLDGIAALNAAASTADLPCTALRRTHYSPSYGAPCYMALRAMSGNSFTSGDVKGWPGLCSWRFIRVRFGRQLTDELPSISLNPPLSRWHGLRLLFR